MQGRILWLEASQTPDSFPMQLHDMANEVSWDHILSITTNIDKDEAKETLNRSPREGKAQHVTNNVIRLR